MKLRLATIAIACLIAFSIRITHGQDAGAPDQPAAKAAKLSGIEVVLRDLNGKVEQLTAEAKRQKNTALTTEVLNRYQKEIAAWLDEKKWEIECTVVDVTAKGGGYLLTCRLPRALQRFTGEDSSAPVKGGIKSYAPRLWIDAALAGQLGKGDVVLLKGKAESNVVLTNTEPDDRFGSISTELFLMSVFLPPLDQNLPLYVNVKLVELVVKPDGRKAKPE